MDELPKATETEVILDGEMVEGFRIKPWTIRKCAEITPVLEKVLVELKKRHLTFRDFIHISKNAEGKEEISINNLDQLFFSVTPFIPDIMLKTMDITEEELNAISQKASFPIIVCIIRQNIEYIKNSFALMTAAIRSLAKMAV